MKKVLVVALILCFITGLAFAETDAFDSLSDAEIVEWREKLDGEMVRRGIEKSAYISKGKYKIEGMIPPGLYKVSIANNAYDSFMVLTYTLGDDGELVDDGYFTYSVKNTNYVLVRIYDDDYMIETFFDSIWIKTELPF